MGMATGAPAGALSCVPLPDGMLEGIAEGEPPEFWGGPDIVSTAVVGRVAERAADPDAGWADGDWLGSLDVAYALGVETIGARMDVVAGTGASDWGVGSLPAEGELLAVYQSRAVGEPVPDRLTINICPNSETVDDERAAAARALAADAATPVAEPGDPAPPTTVPPTTVPPTTVPDETTTSAPPETTSTTSLPAEPTTTTSSAPESNGPSGDDDSSSPWLIWLGVGLAAAAVIGVAVGGPALRR